MVKVELGSAMGESLHGPAQLLPANLAPGRILIIALATRGLAGAASSPGPGGKGISHWRGRPEGVPMNRILAEGRGAKLGLLPAIVLCVAVAVVSGAQQPGQQQSAPEAQQPPPAQPGPPRTPE